MEHQIKADDKFDFPVAGRQPMFLHLYRSMLEAITEQVGRVSTQAIEVQGTNLTVVMEKF